MYADLTSFGAVAYSKFRTEVLDVVENRRLMCDNAPPNSFASFMPITPEDRARANIDKLLTDAGWVVQDKRSTNLSAGRGVAVREFPLKSGHGEADYLLFVDEAPIGVVEAKKEGDTLTGVELQTTK
jgi:hypothetical protein